MVTVIQLKRDKEPRLVLTSTSGTHSIKTVDFSILDGVRVLTFTFHNNILNQIFSYISKFSCPKSSTC
jgi:hypothetical protein